MGRFDANRDFYRKLGPLRYWSILSVTVAFIVALGSAKWWLSEKTGWPDAYGFHCRGRGCFLKNLWHSPLLLANGSVHELLLFAVLWFIPVTTAVTVGAILVRRRWLGRRDRITPPDPE